MKADGGLAAEIEALGRRVFPLQMDVSKQSQIVQAVNEAATHFGRLDILVNNAGIAPGNLAEVVSEADFDATLAVNLKGTFFASQAAGRIMIRQQRGCIVNLSSQAGFIALPEESVYCMTKAGIAHLTKCLAVEWGKYNIRVNAGCAHLHPHARDGRSTCRPRVSSRCAGTDRSAASRGRAGGGGRRRGLSVFFGRISDHRANSID